VFWFGGYGGTSLDDLAAAMQMNRPSIYAAFGDKRSLYLQAVTDYSVTTRSWLAAELAVERPLRDGLRAVYQHARDYYLAGEDGPRGCFLIGTAIVEAARDASTRTLVDMTMAALTEAFTERFARAHEHGELGAGSPVSLGHIATASLNALAVRARSGSAPKELDMLIDATVDVICGRSD
jgi:AcrR family transcriptional regulator